MESNAEHGDSGYLWSLIKDIRFAMITTHRAGEHFQAWPMTMQNQDFAEGKLWFFMSRSGHAVRELQASQNVGVAFADHGKDTYVSLSATARIVDDRSKVHALWSKLDDAWFKGGADDPDVALVELDIVHGHYWDVKESKLVQLFRMAKAALTGQQPRLGESGELRV